MLRSAYRKYCEGISSFGEHSEYFLNQKMRVEFGDGRIEEYAIPDREDYRPDLKDWVEQIFKEDLQYVAKITFYYETQTTMTLYDGPLVECWAQNTE